MTHRSDPRFQTLHALRVRGMAQSALLADMCGSDEAETVAHLTSLANEELVTFRSGHALWHITPEGRVRHVDLLEAERREVNLDAVAAGYAAFLELNDQFKALCTDWQLRQGVINDHHDRAYDASVLRRLGPIDDGVRPLIDVFGAILDRLARYSPRLADSRRRVDAGDVNMLAGVMCGSYHDVWMELHEDLLLTQGLDRQAEGSA